MGYLTRAAGLLDTQGLTLSAWFYVAPQPFTGSSVTHRTLFRCGADIGAVNGQPFSGTTIGCYVSDFGDQVYMDLRNCVEVPAQLAISAPLTGGGAISRGAWNQVVVNFQVLGLNSMSAQMCLNGIIRAIHTQAVANVTAIPLNAGFIGVPTDSVFAQNTTLTPVLPLAQYQMWFYQNISMTSQNMANFFTISGGIGTPKSYLVANTAFGTPELCFVGDPTKFKVNRGTLGDSFATVGTINKFSPGPTFS